MKKSKTLVLGVNYKGVENYAKDYFKSIVDQDTDQFDLLILNDNTASLKLGEMNVNVDEIMISEDKSPALIRYDGLNYAISNNYQNLIFSDFWFSPISGFLDMRKTFPDTLQDFNFDILKSQHF